MVAAKRAYVEAHLTRIAAGTDEERDRATRQFHESARLDPRQPDPYLGLARVAAYWTRDVEALEQAIVAAEERGYTRGRREQAQFGDLYRALGDRAYAAATSGNGEERLEDLDQAASYYERCVESFSGLSFFDSESNLRACRRRSETIAMERERLAPVPDVFEPFLFP
jgi:hypothetical protein